MTDASRRRTLGLIAGGSIASTLMACGLPERGAAVTVNRFCGSSMQAVHMAAGAIAMGAGEAFVCAGVESMTRVPVLGFEETNVRPVGSRSVTVTFVAVAVPALASVMVKTTF